MGSILFDQCLGSGHKRSLMVKEGHLLPCEDKYPGRPGARPGWVGHGTRETQQYRVV